jgi:hypothetical protein
VHKTRRVSPTGNVELIASYLCNGLLTGEYCSCRVISDRSADAAWRLIDRYDETASRIVVVTRSVLDVRKQPALDRRRGGVLRQAGALGAPGALQRR